MNANVHEFKVIAYCNMTGSFLGAFESMEQLREVWPSVEITRIDEDNGCTIVYC